MEGEPRYSRHYVHGAFQGQVETPLRDARLPAVVALLATAARALLDWLP